MTNKELLSLAVKNRGGCSLAIKIFLSDFKEDGVKFEPFMTRPWVNQGTPVEEQIIRVRYLNESLQAQTEERPFWFNISLDRGKDKVDSRVLAEMLLMQKA